MLRVFSFLLLLICCASCNNMSLFKKETHPLDTLIDYTRVDVSPSFDVCQDLIEGKKSRCFREQMHQQLTEQLHSFSFTTHKVIDETVTVVLLIDERGKVHLQEVQSSSLVTKTLPELHDYVKTAIDSLPILSPAIKRGIPVTTEYKLPIRIMTN